jgi:hypothetical protein
MHITVSGMQKIRKKVNFSIYFTFIVRYDIIRGVFFIFFKFISKPGPGISYNILELRNTCTQVFRIYIGDNIMPEAKKA